MKRTIVMAGACLILVVAAAQSVTVSAQQSGTRRHELLRQNLNAPGREVIQVRVEFDPGVAFGAHWHPGEEIAYVLEGTLEYLVEGRPPVTLEAGDVLFIPARAVHSAKNVGQRAGAELATYIVDKGQPLVVMAGGR